MLVFSLLVAAVCVCVLIKVHRVLDTFDSPEEEHAEIWNWPSREWAQSSTEDR